MFISLQSMLIDYVEALVAKFNNSYFYSLFFIHFCWNNLQKLQNDKTVYNIPLSLKMIKYIFFMYTIFSTVIYFYLGCFSQFYSRSLYNILLCINLSSFHTHGNAGAKFIDRNHTYKHRDHVRFSYTNLFLFIFRISVARLLI